jgi:hypothetical protein
MILSDLVRLFSPIILEILDQVVDFSIYGERVGRELDLLDRKLPKKIVCDNGPYFTCKSMFSGRGKRVQS